MKTSLYQPSAAQQELLFAEEVLWSVDEHEDRLLLPIAMLYMQTSSQAGSSFRLSRLDGTVLAVSDGKEITGAPEILAVFPRMQQFFNQFTALFADELTKELLVSRSAEPAAGNAASA